MEQRTANSDDKPCMLLLVEDNEDHAALVIRHLKKVVERSIEFEHVACLSDALERIEDKAFDVLLLDLRLPDSEIHETVPRMVEADPDLPIVVLTSLDDLSLASRTVQEGAQDYLVKSEITGGLLVRAISYAVERKRHALALERSNTELQRFASTLAHEIKSPLAVVSSCFSILKRRYEESFDENTLTLIRDTEKRTNDLSVLVSDLLEFARFDPSLNEAEVDLNVLIEEVIADLKLSIRRRRVEISKAELPSLAVDKALIRQLFHNLLTNAIKFCESTPSIHIGHRDESSRTVFSVSDNGTGLDEEFKATVFEMFQRGANASKVQGTGIGLAFCKRIVEHHGGEIWVESERGKGSTFYFSVPKRQLPTKSVC